MQTYYETAIQFNTSKHGHKQEKVYTRPWFTKFSCDGQSGKNQTFSISHKKGKFVGNILEAHFKMIVLVIVLTCHLFQLDFDTYDILLHTAGSSHCGDLKIHIKFN